MTDQRGEKPWLKRKQPRPLTLISIEVKKTFLILCEGQTERDYFSTFNGNGVKVTAKHLGCTSKELVACAIEYSDGESYDEVWAVYDFDYDAAAGKAQFHRFQESLDQAAANNIKVAYSNDAFELWFRLHYEGVTGPIGRKQLYADLSKRWNVNYEKDGKKRAFREGIATLLSDDEAADRELAMTRASQLFEGQANLSLKDQNPITTVHLLVAALIAK